MTNRRTHPPSQDILSATHSDEGPCPHCGQPAGIERSYEMNDRMFQMLLLALCRQQGIQAYRKGRKTSSRIYVLGPDSAALDRLEARMRELSAKLDIELSKVTAAFLREHTGVELALPESE